ncbi:paeninodin family lasso peptide [Paenibacillus sp. GCM10027628]|uniref:paeninodin family lasso peptide n=1 Tax=Paenibacillus sp. GCM10027628 TaxID=3273413 RepID=UPI0036350CB3
MGQPEQPHISENKKPWSKPHLIMLDVKSTMASNGIWEFTPNGDFWKRELLLES